MGILGLIAGCESAFPQGSRQALEDIVAIKSAEYNCTISAAIFDGHETITAVAGVVEAGTTQKVKPEDAFVWGSGTKPLTGVSILKLVEEGKLHLEDKVAPIVDPLLAEMQTKDRSQNFSSLDELWGKVSGGNVSDVTIHDLVTMTVC